MSVVLHRTVIPIEVPIEHRFAVGDTVFRHDNRVRDADPELRRSVWRIIEVGYAIRTGPYYRIVPVNDAARLITMTAHGRVVTGPTPLVDLLGPVTERISVVDRQCEPYDVVGT